MIERYRYKITSHPFLQPKPLGLILESIHFKVLNCLCWNYWSYYFELRLQVETCVSNGGGKNLYLQFKLEQKLTDLQKSSSSYIRMCILYLPILRFVFFLIEMLKTLDEEIGPHHSGFAVAARDDDDVQTVGLHGCNQTNSFRNVLECSSTTLPRSSFVYTHDTISPEYVICVNCCSDLTILYIFIIR